MVGSITAVGYGLAAIGGGIGVGLIFAAYMTQRCSSARVPEDPAAHAVPGLRTGRGAGNSGPGSRLHQVTGSATS